MKYQKSNQPFDGAIANLFPERYSNLLREYNLRNQMRNGLIHMCAPKSKIGLSQLKHDKTSSIKIENHPVEQNGKLIFLIEYFYGDFADACEKVLAQKFDLKDKMSKPFLSVPN